MKYLYFVVTNAYNLLVSKEDTTVRYMIESNDCVLPNRSEYDDSADFECAAIEFLDTVEDDSNWETVNESVEDVESWLGVDYSNPETPRIIAEKEWC